MATSNVSPPTRNTNANALPRAVPFLLCIFWLVLTVTWWTRPLQRAYLTPQSVGYQLPVNTASAGDLRALHGIGPALAERIVQHRDYHGFFSDPSSLEAVSGIGPRTRARIERWLRFD